MKLTLKTTLSPEMQAKLAEIKVPSLETPGLDPSKEEKELPGKEEAGASVPASKVVQQKKPALQMKKDWRGRLEKIRVVQTWLQETWPRTFNLKDPKPLKRHIIVDIMNQAGDRFSKLQIRYAIRAYTNRRAYLEAVLKGEGRYDLEGSKVEGITTSEQEYSQKVLDLKAQQFAERKAKQAARRHKKLSKKAEGKAVDKAPTGEPSLQED
jgi:hypothetical protein